MSDTYAVTTTPNGDPRPVVLQDLLAGMDPSEYPEMSFKDGDESKKLKFEVAQAGLNWLYRERPMVFADMMLHVMGISATAKPRSK